MVFADDVVSVTLVGIFYGLCSGSAIALVPAVVGECYLADALLSIA